MSEFRTEIGSSNLNLPKLSTLTNNANNYETFLEQGGFDVSAGFEWSDLRIPTARRAGRVLARAGLISVVHESWNEKTIREAGLNLEAIQIAAAFPLLDECYDQLDNLQDQSSKKLPIIVHPSGQNLDGVPPRRPRQTQKPGMFAEVWYQPTAEWAESCGIATDSDDTAAIAEQIVAAQQDAGLDRIALDLHHLTAERAGYRFRNPQALAVALVQAPSFAELQVSIRPDFGGNRSTLIAACNGKLADTETGEILSAIASEIEPTRQIRVVSEIASGEIASVSRLSLNAAHWVINRSIRNILG